MEKAMKYPEIKMFIGGKWITSDAGEPIINPADGALLGHLPHANRADLDAALTAAAAGFEVWRRFTPAERERILLKAAENLKACDEEIAIGLVLDQGKTITEARTEVRIAQERIAWDATEARRIYGRIVPAGPGLKKMVTRHPPPCLKPRRRRGQRRIQIRPAGMRQLPQHRPVSGINHRLPGIGRDPLAANKHSKLRICRC